MTDQIEIARSVPIREAGFNEAWLKDQISEDPACLGLGDLEVIAKERPQASGGASISF